MRDISGNGLRQRFFSHLARTFILAGLIFCAVPAFGGPPGPLPPAPESGVIYHQTFDGFHSTASGDAQAVVPGLGTLVESWSGYALDRSAANVLPWIVPALNVASGHTNLTCNGAGAIRFYYQPYFSSANVAGGTGPGAIARLADFVATSPAGTALVWSLQISPDGTVLRLVSSSDSGSVEVISTLIAWQANQSHVISLNFGPETALFVDGQLVAQGAGTVAVPPTVGALVLGSSIAGTDTGQGSFDEFFSLDHPQDADAAAFYYRFTGAQAALGPLPAEAGSSVLTGGAMSRTSQMSLLPVYDPDHDMTCSPGGPVRLTNIVATLLTNNTTTVSFDIQGGTNGILYDIFSTTFITNSLSSHQWNWIGQGLTCNTYTFTNQPPDLSFYILAVPVQTMTVALGNNDSGQGNVPAGLSNSMAVAGGGYFSLALQNNGTILAWGDNTYGETNVPMGITNAVAIAAGQYHGLLC